MDALKSAQILVKAIDLGEKMWHGQSQLLPPLEPGTDLAADALTGGMAAREPHCVCLLDLVAEIDLEAIHIHYRQEGGLAAVRLLRRTAPFQEA